MFQEIVPNHAKTPAIQNESEVVVTNTRAPRLIDPYIYPRLPEVKLEKLASVQ